MLGTLFFHTKLHIKIAFWIIIGRTVSTTYAITFHIQKEQDSIKKYIFTKIIINQIWNKHNIQYKSKVNIK